MPGVAWGSGEKARRRFSTGPAVVPRVLSDLGGRVPRMTNPDLSRPVTWDNVEGPTPPPDQSLECVAHHRHPAYGYHYI
ncbi:hypothetical protein GCM10027596_09160 [Nocardioides korecus]